MPRTSPANSCLLRTAAVLTGFLTLGSGGMEAQDGVGFRVDAGYRHVGGEWGRALTDGLDAEAAVLYGVGGVRVGLASSWGSLRVQGIDETWHHLTGSALLGYGRWLAPGVRPFAEVRYLRHTARPEGRRFFDPEAALQPIPPFRARGDGVGARLGVELPVSRRATLSLFGERRWFDTEPLPPEYGLGPLSGGVDGRVGVGLTWFAGERRPLGGGDGGFGSDGQGVARNGGEGGGVAGPDLGLAVGVGSLGLLVPWAWNEYVKGKPFTPVSPRSWWRGVTEGFAWDDNEFEVNYWKHPYHGQLYYNAARASGYGVVGSAIQTLVGSYLWECCTETHIPSIPDMVTTSLGGIAVGESLYRVSSWLLDGSARGGERVAREALAGLAAPTRGITRLVTGRAWTVESGPPGPHESMPVTFAIGARVIPDASGLDGGVSPVLQAEWSQGGLLDAREGIFSYHRARVGLHPGERAMLGRVDVRGSLWRGGVADVFGGQGRLAAMLDMEYVDTDAYRWGSHALTLLWAGARPVGGDLAVRVEAGASWVLMGSVDSEYARFAEIRGVRERLRGYDFGTGPGAGLSVSLTGEEGALGGRYRIVILETLNGSNVSGSHAHHVLHTLTSSVERSVAGAVGIRLGLDVFVQRSHYGFPGFVDSTRRRWEGQLQLRWHPGA